MFSNRGKISLSLVVFLVIFAATGAVVAQKNNWIKISADANNVSNVTVSVVQSRSPASGKIVYYGDNKQLSSKATDANGNVTGSVGYGRHKFFVNEPNCLAESGIENINNAAESVNIEIVCSIPISSPTATTTVSPSVTTTASVTNTVTPEPTTGSGTVDLYVYDAKTNKVLSGVSLTAISIYKTTEGKTGSAGYYKFSNLPTTAAGTQYQIIAKKSGYVQQSMSIALKNNDNIRAADIRLLPVGYTPTPTPAPSATTSVDLGTQKITVKLDIKDADTNEYIKGIGVDVKEKKRSGANFTYSSVLQSVARTEDKTLTIQNIAYPSSYGYIVDISEQTYIYNLYELGNADFEILPSKIPANKIFKKEILLKKKSNPYGVVSVVGAAKVGGSSSFIADVGLKISLNSDYGKKTISTNSDSEKLTYIYGRDGKTGVSLPASLGEINYQSQERNIHYSFLEKSVEIEISPPAGFYYDTNDNGVFDESADNRLKVDKAKSLIFEGQDSASFEKIGTILKLDISLLPVESTFTTLLSARDKNIPFPIGGVTINIYRKEKSGAQYVYTKIANGITPEDISFCKIENIPFSINDRYGYRIEMILPSKLASMYKETKKTIDVSQRKIQNLDYQYDANILFEENENFKSTIVFSGRVADEDRNFVEGARLTYKIGGLTLPQVASRRDEISSFMVNLSDGGKMEINPSDIFYESANYISQMAYNGNFSDFSKKNEATIIPPKGFFYDTNGDGFFELRTDNRIILEYGDTYARRFDWGNRIMYLSEKTFSLKKIPDKPNFVVQDEESRKIIPDASVVLEDVGCNFKITAKTVENQTGMVTFTDEDLNKAGKYYDRVKSGVCISRLFARISARSFSTYILKYSFEDFKEIFSEGQSVPLSLRPVRVGVSGGSIYGYVVSPSPTDNKPLSNIKVTLLKNNIPVSFTATNADGAFEFNGLVAGDYSIAPFSMDYRSGSDTFVSVSLKKNEQVLVVSNMYPYDTTQSISSFIHVFDQNSLQPIGGVKVIIECITEKTKKNFITGEAGEVFFATENNKRYAISIMSPDPENKLLAKKEVDTTFYAHGFEERREFEKELFFAIDYHNRDFFPGKIDISAKDNEGKLIPDVDLTISVENNPYYNLKGKTDAQGEATFLDDFSVDVDKDFRDLDIFSRVKLEDIKIFRGASLNISYAKKGYLSGRKEVIIANEDQISVEIVAESIGKNSDTTLCYELRDALGEFGKYEKSVLEVSDTKDGEYTEFHDSDNYSNCYKIIDFNKFYRVRLTLSENQDSLDLVSESVRMSKGDKKNVVINGCGANKPKLVKNYGENVYFVFADEESFEYYSTNQAALFNSLAQQVKMLKNRSKNVEPLAIIFGGEDVIKDAGGVNAFAYIGSPYDVCVSKTKIVKAYKIVFTPSLLKTLINENRLDLIAQIITHEYGHHVYENNTNLMRRWQYLFDSISNDSETGACVWNSIKESNIAYSWLGGHPSDSSHEMFASFYSSYFANHERLYGFIKYHTEENSKCQNTLKFMWQYFAESVGEYYSNDDQYFKPVGGEIGNAAYPYSYITKGDWLQENFDEASINARVNIQYRRLIRPVLDAITNITLTSAVASFNTWLDNELSVLGLIRNVGTIKGRIVDQDGNAIQNAVVTIGIRNGLSGKNGQFNISKVPVGEQKIYVVETKDGAYRIISPSSITVVKRKQANVTITVE